MSVKKITVNATWDGQAGVWVATSDDVPGLVIEAANCDELFTELREMVPELLRLNGSGDDTPATLPIEVRSHTEFQYL